MPEITKRASFYPDRRNLTKTFHVEADGAVVNITVGLSGPGGRRVTRVDVSPDDETRGGDAEGRLWIRPEAGDARLIRLHEGETRADYAAANDQSAEAPSSPNGAGGLDAEAARTVLKAYLAEPDDQPTPPERVDALVTHLWAALAEVARLQALVPAEAPTRLVCLRCGSDLRPEEDVRHTLDGAETFVVGLECTDKACGARWSLDGDPTNPRAWRGEVEA